MFPTTLAGAEFTATSTYSSAQYSLVLYSFVVAAFALFATGVYGAKTTSEVSKAYRPAVLASTLVCWIATLAYVALVLEWVLGFQASPDGSTFTPRPGTVVTELRYMDWSVTVPLLTVELLAVAVLTRSQAFRLRTVAVPSAFLMIATGYLGVVYGADARQGTGAALWVWGAVSTVFFVVLYVVAWRAYRSTRDEVSAETRTSYRNALVLLLSVFGAYPLAYLVPAWAGASDAGWATTEQLVFTFADIAAKAGFGLVIHKVAKLRTAEDTVAAGGDTEAHRTVTLPDSLPGEVWVSGTLLSVPAAVTVSPSPSPVPSHEEPTFDGRRR
ncbi:bacteriorhodopsin [Kineococcus sp. TBRC 1896]|uniref:Bacteriorhodopsin n=1 Tax=Kineococcus mangrovi TaxID=1660183 RepID=A0ABV4I333_9ACTN